MRDLRAQHDIGPICIHASYLINCLHAKRNPSAKTPSPPSVARSSALSPGAPNRSSCTPGSWKGLTREEGLRLAAQSIERAVDGISFSGHDFHILIENTAGAEFSLGGKLEQVAELVETLKTLCPRRRLSRHLPRPRRRLRYRL